MSQYARDYCSLLRDLAATCLTTARILDRLDPEFEDDEIRALNEAAEHYAQAGALCQDAMLRLYERVTGERHTPS